MKGSRRWTKEYIDCLTSTEEEEEEEEEEEGVKEEEEEEEEMEGADGTKRASTTSLPVFLFLPMKDSFTPTCPICLFFSFCFESSTEFNNFISFGVGDLAWVAC